MTKQMESLIVKQALKIDSLSDDLHKLQGSVESAISILTCIGGPLNDNTLGFTPEQLRVFQSIYVELMMS